jgi:hypothetical protein
VTDYTELAIHEAAHAVAAIHFGHDFSLASLYPDSDSAAHVRMSSLVSKNLEAAWGKRDPKNRATIVGYVIVCLAGALAVRRAAGDKLQGMPWDRYGAAADYEAAWGLMPSTGVTWDWVKRRTNVFLALNWPAVMRLAGELRDRRIMTSREIRELVEEER